MKKFTLPEIEATANYNRGQQLEQRVRFALTGRLEKADNRLATECADCADIQIKSYHATICKGTDIDGALAIDAAERYAYATKDDVCYLMSKSEWGELCHLFHYVTRESAKNGGATKTRLLRCEGKIIAWCEEKLQ